MTRPPAFPAVPTYALYGERQPWLVDWLHCESIAERSRLHDWEIRPHRHELFVQILVMRAGSGEAAHGDRRHALQAPCVVFVPTLVDHGFRFSPDVDGTVITVLAPQFEAMVAGRPELAACFEHWRCEAYPARDESAFEAIDAALRRVVAEFAGNAAWRQEAIDAALRTAVVLLGRTMAPRAPADAEVGPARQAHLQRFRQLLDASFRSERSIGYYAERLGMTPTHLNRLCRQALGRSVLGAINARLVTEAERDLAYTALSVKAIALSLGFADAAYFTRFFARQTGRSPSDFRRAAHEQLAAHRTTGDEVR